MNKLLIVGSIAYDSIITPFGKINKTLGGSASYFSLASSHFTKASVVGVVGDDFKQSYKAVLAKHAEISGLAQAQGKTFHWAGKYNFDLNSRDTLKTELGVFQNFKPELSLKHQNSQFVFLGNIHPKLQLEVLRQIKKPKFVGLDTMNYWIESAKGDLEKVLKKVDCLIINDSEARELSKEHNILKAAKKILGMMRKTTSPQPSPNFRREPILIIKRGEYGLLMFNKNRIFHLPGFPLEDVVDPTGAGDSFAGGFMGYLAKTQNTTWDNLKKACASGSAVASICVEGLGTTSLQKLKATKITERLKIFRSLTQFS